MSKDAVRETYIEGISSPEGLEQDAMELPNAFKAARRQKHSTEDSAGWHDRLSESLLSSDAPSDHDLEKWDFEAL